MKISILISSYNKGKYIRECIESCLIQEDQKLEIILFDNYSNDETDQILLDFQNKIQIYKSQKISDFSAINQIDLLRKAFEVSSGEIICLLDADDYFKKEKIKNVRNFFEREISKDVLFDLPTIKSAKNFEKFKLKKKFFKNIWNTTIPTSSISFKREFFENLLKKNLFKDYNLLEIDFRINVYAQNITKNFKIYDQSLNVYRKVDDGIMSQNKKFSPNWWKKRLQAHEFMKNSYLKQSMDYKNLDFDITRMLVNLFKF